MHPYNDLAVRGLLFMSERSTSPLRCRRRRTRRLLSEPSRSPWLGSSPPGAWPEENDRKRLTQGEELTRPLHVN